MSVQAQVVQGRWLAVLAAMRAVEHLVLGGVVTVIVMDRLTAMGISLGGIGIGGISIGPVVRAIFGGM